MTEYSNTNRGALFKNDKKQSDSHPDYKGSLNVEGVEYWVSSWIKVSKTGDKFMSLSVQPKEGQQQPPQAPQRTQPPARSQAPRQAPAMASSGFDDMNSDVPF
jgi:hypothetical protein